MPVRLRTALILLAAGMFPAAALPQRAPADKPDILPLSQIKPGMKGVAHTIFAGDQIEQIELEVIGIIPNFSGPKEDIILVVLKGAKAEYTGVVGGMSGSPVYIEGKLAGALSYRIGIFSKEPLAGVTPIESVLKVDQGDGTQKAGAATEAQSRDVVENSQEQEKTLQQQYVIPNDLAQRAGLGAGAFLMPIETPLIFSGFRQETLARFSNELSAFGMMAGHGGQVEARADDADLKPGDMVGMVLMQGDLALQSGCTVTAIVQDRVFICGHPWLGLGNMEMPMTRGRVLATAPSSMASVKIMNSGGVIGTLKQDRLTAMMGKLGAPPRMVPVELTLVTPTGERTLHFEMIDHPKITPLLISIAAFNGLVSNTVYSDGTTLRLTGGIELKGHPTVQLENMFAPTDQFVPDGFFVAGSVQQIFARIFTNPYERAQVEKVTLRVESIAERRWAGIESAWSERSEVSPGEKIKVKVLLRPYRGAPFIREVPIQIPQQAAKGPMRIMVSDSEALNRMSRVFSSGAGRLPGLDQLIALLNRERRNSRLYVTLLQPSPTLLLEDKELPNAPVSQINVLDQRRTGGSSVLLRESVAGEWSLGMNQVIAGTQYLTITVK